MIDPNLAKFQIKDDQILFFIDYNRTLVNYDLVNTRKQTYFRDTYNDSPIELEYLIKALKLFEQNTGFQPVVCVVTNTDQKLQNLSGETMMLRDFYDYILNRGNDEVQNLIRKYFKFTILSNNDGFYEINENFSSFENAYIRHQYPDAINRIKFDEHYKKLETVEKHMCVVDPTGVSRVIVFAGDNRSDYHMALMQTTSAVRKIFIETTNERKSIRSKAKRKERNKLGLKTPKKISYDKMRRFVLEREGRDVFTTINYNSGKKFISVDDDTIGRLSDEDRAYLEGFSKDLNGNIIDIIITGPNSNGLIKGIKKANEIVLKNIEPNKDGYQL